LHIGQNSPEQFGAMFPSGDVKAEQLKFMSAK
jgi:hypothetical protein